MKNIKYKTKEHFLYMAETRSRWDGFYTSEKWVFEKIAGKKKSLGDILDIGCATGGLGSALSEKFTFDSYTGIDINKEAIDFAKKTLNLKVPVNLIAGDVLDVNFKYKAYDTVFSLSCADWNIESDKIIEAGWRKVRQGGYFIVSTRITNKPGINDIHKSFQYINPHISSFEKKNNPDIANYVVFNAKNFLTKIKNLRPAPEIIGAYGYWGKPSATAVTPFDKLVFTVFYIKKGRNGSKNNVRVDLQLPFEILISKEDEI